ncbi:MAG TPA: VCBS repeat-containing protein [Isosphaeraceae bacterium]
MALSSPRSLSECLEDWLDTAFYGPHPLPDNDYCLPVLVLLGRGDGTFTPGQRLGVGWSPNALVAGDFDGDGYTDLVTIDTLATVNLGFSDVLVLMGRGDGTFAPRSRFPVGVDARALVAADYTGDGRVDLISANFASSDVSVLLGVGDGAFADIYSILTNIRSTPQFGSFTRASTGNLVSGLRLNIVSIVPGRPNNFPGLNSRSPASVDINRDGYGDLYNFSGDGEITVILRGVDGSPHPEIQPVDPRTSGVERFPDLVSNLLDEDETRLIDASLASSFSPSKAEATAETTEPRLHFSREAGLHPGRESNASLALARSGDREDGANAEAGDADNFERAPNDAAAHRRDHLINVDDSLQRICEEALGKDAGLAGEIQGVPLAVRSLLFPPQARTQGSRELLAGPPGAGTEPPPKSPKAIDEALERADAIRHDLIADLAMATLAASIAVGARRRDHRDARQANREEP